MNHSYRATFNKLWSKSYVFRKKAKIIRKCAKGGPSTIFKDCKAIIVAQALFSHNVPSDRATEHFNPSKKKKKYPILVSI